jgi:hypothetical protein
MIKHYCDCCGEETQASRLSHFEYKVHLDKIYLGLSLSCHSDDSGNIVSRRYEEYELCSRCYNDVVYEAVVRLQELREVNKVNESQ